MAGHWVSAAAQQIGSILFRKGDQWPHEQNPRLQPKGVWIWREELQSYDDGDYLTLPSSTRGRVSWVLSKDRMASLTPKIAGRDLLRGEDVVDVQATLAAKNREFERTHLPEQQRSDSELQAEYEKSLIPVRLAKQDREREKAAAELEIAETVAQADTSDMEDRLEKLLVEEESLEAAGDSAALDRVRNEIAKLLSAPIGGQPKANGGR